MSHAATTIRGQFVTALTGVTGLPTPVVGMPRQIAEATAAVVIEPRSEEVTIDSIVGPAFQRRELTIVVAAFSTTYDAADAMSLLIEEALQGITCKPQLRGRIYDRNAETIRDGVGVALTYAVQYGATANDIETPMF